MKKSDFFIELERVSQNAASAYPVHYYFFESMNKYSDVRVMKGYSRKYKGEFFFIKTHYKPISKCIKYEE